MEDIHGVGFADFEAKAVENDGSLYCGMQTAEIQRELSIDEKPQIIISSERESLTAFVHKLRVDLGRKMIIVNIPLIPKAIGS